jgi:hypothetical protein
MELVQDTMKTELRNMVMLAVAAGWLWCGNNPIEAQAQRPSRQGFAVDPTTGMPIPGPTFDEFTEGKRITVAFEGLPLAEVVETLRKEFPKANFVCSQEIAGQNSSLTLKLRQARLEDVLDAIQVASNGTIEYELRGTSLVAFFTPMPPQPPGGMPHGVVPSVPERPQETQPQQQLPAPTYRILNLREDLQIATLQEAHEVLKTIQDIAQQTLANLHPGPQFGPGSQAPKLSYHEGSGLLVLVGQKESINLVIEIVSNLRKSAMARSRGGRSGPVPPGIEAPSATPASPAQSSTSAESDKQ